MHAPALDGLRGLSAQVVFISHAIALLTPAPWPLLQHALSWSARTAVIVFFGLSGYVITASILRSVRGGAFGLVRFAVRRVARIYPPYLLTIALCWLAWIMLPEAARPAAASPLAETARALAFLNRSSDVVTQLDGPLWSLRLEVVCYALAGLLAFWWTRRGNGGLGAIAALVLALTLTVATPFAVTFGLSAFVWFGVGGLAAAGALSAWATWGLRVSLVLFAAGIPLTLDPSFAFGAADTPAAMMFQAVFALAVAAAIAQLATGKASRLAAASSLGDFSYTLYLVHMPLILLAAHAASALELGGPARLAVLAAVLAAVEAFAWGAARILERPAEVSAAIFLGLARLGWRDVTPRRQDAGG